MFWVFKISNVYIYFVYVYYNNIYEKETCMYVINIIIVLYTSEMYELYKITFGFLQM